MRLAAALTGALLGGLPLALAAPAAAEDATIPGTLDSSAVNTSRIDIPVPVGIRPRAITGVLTMPEVVDDGVVTFRVNGRIARSVPSTLYAKVRIPVSRADVVANGTIGLTVSSQGPAIGDVCRPAAGEATFRKIALVYGGTAASPATLAQFFPRATHRIDVLIPPDADDDMVEAGLSAVAALGSRYPAGTDIVLGSTEDAPTGGVASQRAVVFAVGRAGEVTTDISTVPRRGGVPTLTITATGDDLAAAARALVSTKGGDQLQLAGDPDAEGISGELGKRDPELEQTLGDIDPDAVSVSGYGVTSQVVEIPQDVFSTPVSSLDVHLEGAHTAVSDPDRARLDVRMNGELVGSTPLDDTGDLSLDFTIPAGRLRSVNQLEVVLSATTPDGLPCAAPGSPPIEVDLDPSASTFTATAGEADVRGFQLLPQALQSSLPVAIRPDEAQARFEAVVHASRIVAALQDAAAYPLDIQVVPADAFVADDRNGLLVGASTNDATSLDAPLKLSSIRLLDQDASSFEVTSQEPYAVLESIDDADRHVLMLGGWSPGNEPAPRPLVSKVVDYLSDQGWARLQGDLLITDASSAPFTVDSRTLSQDSDPTAGEDDEGNAYAKWFIAAVVLLLVLIGFQVVVSIRRDRAVASAEGDQAEPEVQRPRQPAYLEDLEFREQHLRADLPRESAPPVETAPPVESAPAEVPPPPGAERSTSAPKVTKRTRGEKRRRP